MPASRRQRATTRTPRSWPSRPTLAINTRMFSAIMASAPAGTSCACGIRIRERRLTHFKISVKAREVRGASRPTRCSPGRRRTSRMRTAHAKSRSLEAASPPMCYPSLVASPPPTLIDQAYEAMLAAICDGRLAPSQRINQDDLATSLGISRQPVGQALSLLKWQGFVRDTGRRGLIVAPIDPDFFRAIYQLREALDSLAASLAARRRGGGAQAPGRRQGHAALRTGRGADRRRHAVPHLDLRRRRQPAALRGDAPLLEPPPPRHGRGAARPRRAEAGLGRARRGAARHRVPRSGGCLAARDGACAPGRTDHGQSHGGALGQGAARHHPAPARPRGQEPRTLDRGGPMTAPPLAAWDDAERAWRKG